MQVPERQPGYLAVAYALATKLKLSLIDVSGRHNGIRRDDAAIDQLLDISHLLR